MTIVRTILQEKTVVGGVLYVQEPKEFTLTPKELRAAYNEQLLKDKIEDITTELEQMERDSDGEFQAYTLYGDREAIAKDLIEHMEYDEQGYQDKVRQAIERFM